METDNKATDAAQIGKMFVTAVSFQWHSEERHWDGETRKDVVTPGHWNITATLCDKPTRYGNTENMTVKVEQGVGLKLAEVLLPVIIAEASRKAQQLADDSKAMIAALGNRTLACIADMPKAADLE